MTAKQAADVENIIRTLRLEAEREWEAIECFDILPEEVTKEVWVKDIVLAQISDIYDFVAEVLGWVRKDLVSKENF